MCDVLLGVPECVTKCDKNSVTYFMDGPIMENYRIVLNVNLKNCKHFEQSFSLHTNGEQTCWDVMAHAGT